MDSNAIKEIANQLGVGADYLLNHLSEFAPKWAAMQVAKSGVACVFLAVALVLSWRLFMSALHDTNDDDLSCYSDIVLFVGLICGFLSLGLFIALALNATDLVTHVASPEAAMLNDMLKAVQK